MTADEARTTVNLRRMTRENISEISRLENQLFPVDPWPVHFFEMELAHPTRTYWVAESEGHTVGYAGLMCVATVADVQTIAVVPEREGQGIGSALLSRLIEDAVTQGAEEVLLEVRQDNPRAQALYIRFGFEQIFQRPGYYRDGVTALIMRKDLTSLETPEGNMK